LVAGRAEAKEAAITELLLGLAESDPDPAISAIVATEHDARRLGVATDAVDRLEAKLAATQARVADCERLCRKHAVAVPDDRDAIAIARTVEVAEATIVEKRASLLSLVAVLTDATRGTGRLPLRGRVSRMLVDHADRLVATLSRGPWQGRLAELVAGPAELP
jgi:hypothetical protein